MIEMGDGEVANFCRQPTSFYLLAVALRSFLLVLATHLLAGEVDTTLGGAALAQRLWWWCRYYNPLNLSWRYYSMFAFRCMAPSWGTHQLALINHEEHPFLPPLPYIVGDSVPPLRVRRLEMAGLLSSQGILTFSAAYQGFLALQYAISTEGIPYLPNVTVPLAMVGLFRVMASKWVASKIQVDAYPYPCLLEGSAAELSTLKSIYAIPPCELANLEPLPPSPHALSSVIPPLANSGKKAHAQDPKSETYPSSTTPPAPSRSMTPGSPSVSQVPVLSHPDSLLATCTHSLDSPSCSLSLLSLSESSFVFPTRPPLQTDMPPSAPSLCNTTTSSSNRYQIVASSTSSQPPVSPLSQHGQFHLDQDSSSLTQAREYRSNKIVVAGWMGVLVGLVTLSFLPYKVAAAYQLPLKLLQFSMQLFYQYIAVSEFVFHAFLLYQGPRALANRVSFFDHWTFKAQTAGFFCLLMFMLVVSLMDFVKNGFYRNCA